MPDPQAPRGIAAQGQPNACASHSRIGDFLVSLAHQRELDAAARRWREEQLARLPHEKLMGGTR